MSRQIIKRQFIDIVEHNKYITNDNWNNRIIFIIERVFYNDDTSEKRFIKEEDPTIIFHLTKPEHALARHSYSIKEELCDVYETKFNFGTRSAAELTDQLPYYKAVRGYDRKRVHLHKDLHGSDVNIIDHYIKRYFDEHADTVSKNVVLTKGYYDIEVDGKGLGRFPDEEEAPVPVNLINYYYDQTKIMHVYMNPFSHLTNDYYGEFAKRLYEDESFLKSFEKRLLLYTNFKCFQNAGMIDGNIDKPTTKDLDTVKSKLRDLNKDELKALLRCHRVKINVFDNELDLLGTFLNQVVNIDKPDVMTAWNAKFDILTIQNRLYRLGVDPEEHFTPEDMKPYGLINYKIDTFNDKIPDKKDKFTCIGYSIWTDSMLIFASLRKQMGLRPSYSLNAIIESEINESKYDLGDIGIVEAPYIDYEAFLIYGALDVIPLHTLEEAVGDIDTAYQISLMTQSQFHKNMTKTNILRNFAVKFYKDYGLIISNNRNAFNDTFESFRGALILQEHFKSN